MAIRKLVAIGAFASIVSSGCARLVTVNRDEAAFRNDLAWRLQGSPKPPGEPAVTVVPIGAPPWRNEPEIQAALRSNPDRYGVPVDLYAVDNLLLAHRSEMDSQASARHSTAAGSVVMGLVFGGLGMLEIAIESSNPNEANHTHIGDGVFWGTLTLGLSAGFVVAGIIIAATGSDPRPLQRYYRETYVDPR